MTDPRILELTYARKVAQKGDLDTAWKIVQRYLTEDPHDIEALVVGTYACRKARNMPVAYHLARAVTEVAPHEPAGWINLGQICNELWIEPEAERAYKRGLEIAKSDHDRCMVLHNLSAFRIDQGEFEEGGRYAERSLAINPDSKGARANLGFAQLAAHDWEAGWKNYHACLGGEFRKRTQYKDEPEWDGAPGKSVVLYGEQGLGDEICFASMVPDALNRAGKVILDIDHRLEGLFRRSFPKAKVYGTRHAEASDGRKWDKEDRDFDCSLALAQIGEFFRLSDDDFPTEPYIVPDPERVLMWRALFATKQKPVIGIAWTGGIQQTGAKYRNLNLDMLLPILQAVDAHWVCLQYKPAQKQIDQFRAKYPEIDLREYPQATLTNDYDDTAGLVAALDGVVSLPTAVVHLAGAMGVPCIAMKSPKSCWKFKNGLAWHKQVRLIENDGSWDRTIRQAAKAVRAFDTRRKAA